MSCTRPCFFSHDIPFLVEKCYVRNVMLELGTILKAEAFLYLRLTTRVTKYLGQERERIKWVLGRVALSGLGTR